MTDEFDQAGRMKELFAGELTEEESAVLVRIRELFQAVVDKRAQFNLVAEIVGAKVLYLARSGLDPNVYGNIDAQFFRAETGKDLPYLQDGATESTEAECAFAADVVGAIDFSLRNGVGVGFIVNMLSHDFGEIFSRGSLDATLAAAVLPKCSGYHQFTESSIGDPDPNKD